VRTHDLQTPLGQSRMALRQRVFFGVITAMLAAGVLALQ
jgi:hypothetical protein